MGKQWQVENKYYIMNMTNEERKFKCPCCGYFTYSEKPNNTFQLCEVCFWEDDGIQFNDPLYEDGANKVNLEQARRNFKEFGASERIFLDNVREPFEEEK